MRKRYSKEFFLKNKEQLIINTIVFIQAVEGINTTPEQALTAYNKIKDNSGKKCGVSDGWHRVCFI